MKDRNRNSTEVKDPNEKRFGIIDRLINVARVCQRTAKDIDERAEAIELERILQKRKETLKA